jgi:hypothetical protein
MEGIIYVFPLFLLAVSIFFFEYSDILNMKLKFVADLVVIEFTGFLITNSLLLCGSFRLTATSLCKMLRELYHKQMVISLI